jgi:hypothetical protein
VENEPVKQRFHDLWSVPPETNDHTPECCSSSSSANVEKYRKLLQNDKP